MDELEVDVDELRVAGAAGAVVADGVRALTLAQSATRIGDALPGGAAERTGDLLAVAWSAAATTTADAVARHSANMLAAAQAYGEVEHVHAAAFGG